MPGFIGYWQVINLIIITAYSQDQGFQFIVFFLIKFSFCSFCFDTNNNHHQLQNHLKMSLSTMLDKLNSERSPSSLSTYSNDSYHMQRGGYDRGRSPSPTEFFRTKIENYDHIWSREHELNEFIHNGIQKFLDKQAVRDLIHAYDLEDIFVHGEEHFFENVFEDFDNSKTMDELSLQKNQKGKFAQLIDVYNGYFQS